MVLPVAINCFQLIEIAFVPRGICHFGPPWDLQRALRLTSLGPLGPPSFNLSVFTHFVGLVLCDLVSVEKSTAGKVSADESFADLSKGYLDYGGKNPFPPTTYYFTHNHPTTTYHFTHNHPTTTYTTTTTQQQLTISPTTTQQQLTTTTTQQLTISPTTTQQQLTISPSTTHQPLTISPTTAHH